MTEINPEYGLVVLDGKRYPVQGNVTVEDTARFARKLTINDYTRDSDDLISALVLSSFTGGGQIEVANESSDAGRYSFGNLYAESPQLLSLQREIIRTTQTAGGANAGGAWPLGDLGNAFYGVFGTLIHTWNETTLTWVSTGVSLPAVPVGSPVTSSVGGTVRMYVPLGANGIAIWNGTTVTTVATPAAIALLDWDNSVVSLSTTGQLHRTLDGAVWTLAVSVDQRFRPRGLQVFFDRSGTPNVHVVTDRRVFSWDVTNALLFPTELSFPAHPQNGIANTYWRNALYVSAGLEIYQYVGSSISAMGPTRDQGMPGAYRGRIVDMVDEHNGIYALIEGQEVVSDVAPAEGGTQDPGQLNGPELRGLQASAESCLMKFTGFGWHAIWTSPGPITGLTTVMTSEAVSGQRGDGYRVWWGAGGYLYSQVNPVDFHNPRQGVRQGLDRFQTTGYLDTPWFDFNMPTFAKLLSHVQINMESICDGDLITLDYQLDYDPTWYPLGTAGTTGPHLFGFGAPLDPEPTNGSIQGGIACSRVRFRITMTGPGDCSPIMDSFVVKFIKVPLSVNSWRFAVPLTWTDELFGRTAGEMKDELSQLLISERFLTFTHGRKNIEGQSGGETYRVYMTQLTGNDETGSRDNGVRYVSLVEIPITGTIFAGQS